MLHTIYLYPTDLPQNVRVFDERIIEGEFRVVDEPKAPAAVAKASPAPPAGPTPDLPAENQAPTVEGPPAEIEADPLAESQEEEPAGAEPEDDFDRTFGPQRYDAPSAAATKKETPAPGPGGELPMTSQEMQEAEIMLRDIVKDSIKRLQDKKDAQGAELWPPRKIREEIAKITGRPMLKVEDIQVDFLGKVANRLDELAMA